MTTSTKLQTAAGLAIAIGWAVAFVWLAWNRTLDRGSFFKAWRISPLGLLERSVGCSCHSRIKTPWRGSYARRGAWVGMEANRK